MRVKIKNIDCKNINDCIVLKLVGEELDCNFPTTGLDYEEFASLDECYLHEMQDTAEELLKNEEVDYTIEIEGGQGGYVTITFELETENEENI
ncbi:hypothetical protein [uncultured Clostridium sp.]|uniref:hypothetical protein n=1 Tax=uncultured Clostridium sp. TaxID=59620 RepID=UPI0025D55898|nr:hypothetical protein [uncultured Clostridium sp.]